MILDVGALGHVSLTKYTSESYNLCQLKTIQSLGMWYFKHVRLRKKTEEKAKLLKSVISLLRDTNLRATRGRELLIKSIKTFFPFFSPSLLRWNTFITHDLSIFLPSNWSYLLKACCKIPYQRFNSTPISEIQYELSYQTRNVVRCIFTLD